MINDGIAVIKSTQIYELFRRIYQVWFDGLVLRSRPVLPVPGIPTARATTLADPVEG